MAITAEMNYLDFHNAKDNLAPGHYRVIEADGDTSIAKVVEWVDHRLPTVTWLTEDEYSAKLEEDKALADSWEYSRITPDDLAEADRLADEVSQAEYPSHHEYLASNVNTTLADILREAMSTDSRNPLVEQNRKDGV